MKYLVTGGAGFIGSHLCARLIHDGHTVVCVDNFITGSQENIVALESSGRFTLMRHDITKPLDVDGPLDAVLHFASPASPIDYLKFPIPTLKVGALGTHNALGIAKAKRARFLLASTSEVYGDPLVNPQPESYWGNVNPIGPRGVYDEAKRFAEAITMAYHREHGVDTRIVRIFNTFGPRMRQDDGRVVPTLILQALRGEPLSLFGNGSQTRSFCYVDDLVDGLLKLLGAAGVHDPVNLGNPREMTVRELADEVLRLTRSTSRIVFKPLPQDDPKVRRPDITRATQLLGWAPRVALEEGLTKTIRWWQDALAAGPAGGAAR